MSGQWKSKFWTLASQKTLRTIYILMVMAALALAAGAPYAWGGGGP